MGDVNNEYQFHTVAPGYEPKKRGATGSKTERNTKVNESPGKVIATHPQDGVVGALSYSHKEWSGGGMGRGVDVAMVDPAHRGPEFRTTGKAAGRGGVADAMYNIASREMGYKLGHSNSLTKSGAKFANRVGGPTTHGREPRANLRDIPLDKGGLNTDLLQNDLASRATPVDPVIGRALTPMRSIQRRNKVVQPTLPGTDWNQY